MYDEEENEKASKKKLQIIRFKIFVLLIMICDIYTDCCRYCDRKKKQTNW